MCACTGAVLCWCRIHLNACAYAEMQVAFAVDTLFVGFFVAATVVGVYFGFVCAGGCGPCFPMSRVSLSTLRSNIVHGLSLQSMRPTRHGTSIRNIIANLAIIQLLSYALPAAAWILGLGAFDLMQVRTTPYERSLGQASVFVRH